MSSAFLDMAKDCRGAIFLDADESVPCKRSSLVSMVSKFCSIFSEDWRRDLMSEHADSSLMSVSAASSCCSGLGENNCNAIVVVGLV